MRLLLDTDVLIWHLSADARLRPDISELIEVEEEVFLSVASLWELEIKAALGKISVEGDVLQAAAAMGASWLPIETSDAIAAARLPRHHNDPLDRMLIAQAVARGLTIVTGDRVFERYTVPLIVV